MPGRPATDQQVRLYMENRHHHTQRVAAARSGLSERTGRRIERDPRLSSQKAAERKPRRQTLDPFGGLWESDIVPLLAARPGLRLPHPSGANRERIDYFLHRKDRDKLSIKISPTIIDAARTAIQNQMARLMAMA